MNLPEKEVFERKLFTGFFQGEVIGINPNLAELSKVYGYTPKEDAKEPTYEGRTEQGDDFVDIVFYIKVLNHEDKPILSNRIRLVDKDVVFETDDNGVKTSKMQYINNVGTTTSVDDEKNLLDKFTKIIVKGQDLGTRQYRKAIQSEGNLANFLQSWLDKGVAFYGEASKDTNIFLDKKKAFRNIAKYVNDELKPLISSPKAGKFNALAIVGISEKDGKVSHFQNIYNNFWPEWKFKSMVTSINTGDWNINDDTRKSYEYLVKSLKKSAFTLGWIKIFDPQEHLSATNEVFRAPVESSNDEVDTNY